MKIKSGGDALRNTITKMPSEGIDVVSWFVSINKLFEQLSVPADLQTILIRPYLSDRAKILMSKCDPTHSAKYENIRSFLLKELHLSPAVYLEKFNSLTQDKSETYTQFSTRLILLFEYYLESRKIGQSYDKLTDLMVYDRVKSCLSPALSRYVLSLDEILQDGWSCLKYIEVDVDGLSDTVIALNDSGCQLCADTEEKTQSDHWTCLYLVKSN